MIDVTKIDLTDIYNLAGKLVNKYKSALEENKINASGTLSKSVDFDVDFDEYHLAIYFLLESYYYQVEHGRGPSTGKFGVWRNKYNDIENWVRNKIRRGWFIPTTSYGIPKTDKEIKRVSGAIVHKISKYGFYGYDSSGKHILEGILKECEDDGLLDDIIDKIFEEYYTIIELEFGKI